MQCQDAGLEACTHASLQCQNAELEARVLIPLQCQDARLETRIPASPQCQVGRLETRVPVLLELDSDDIFVKPFHWSSISQAYTAFYMLKTFQG